MKVSDLASAGNLELAWRRITTGGNYQYKRFYRDLYYAYEVALPQNLDDLQQRLLGGSFQARCPERVYVPKASGLHRPLALLNIEDQIVLQAFANLAARRMQKKRAPLQFKVVFSNILQKSDSIFFFRRWQDTYGAFQTTIKEHYDGGLRWVGDFDLAAFYDTISHELLLRTIYPRTSGADLEWFADCLKTWSSDSAASGHGHGLPQGLLASDFLAECFLLPIDICMKGHTGYIRYVDDVRLLGATENEVRSDLIELERRCRERGLIPQAGKFAIRRALNVQEAMGMLPSIADPQHEDGSTTLSQAEARAALKSSIGGKPYRVTDKTRLRFVLFRAAPDSVLLNLTLRLIPRHPEHADVFFTYLGRFAYRKPIEQLCTNLVADNPYPYVRGEAWHVLARYGREPRSMTATSPELLLERAIDIAKKKSRENLAERWGACHFLCAMEDETAQHLSRWLEYQDPLLQALLAPALPDGAFAAHEAVARFLRRTTPEPGLSVCSAVHERGIALESLGLTPGQLPSQVSNTLRALGVISTPGVRVDPIAETLNSRYGVLPAGKSWHTLLAGEYVHALGLLNQAEATFNSGRSYWLACQNSFNQAVFLALQRHLNITGHPASCTTVNRKGELLDYGVTLDAGGPFSKNCPTIAGVFRAMNARRNRLPASHPYDKKTVAQSALLEKKERDKFVADLRSAYCDFVTLMP